MTYYLPDPISRLVASRLPKCKNLGLILDKYPPSNAIGGGKGKGDWFREIVPEEHVDFQLAEHVYNRWLTLTSIEGTQRFSAVTDWRMVIGLGGETVLETDLTLHHVYGIPYIPASALKGLTRAYAAGEKSTPPSIKIEDDNERLMQIFGTQDHAGTVVFFDAMPKEGRVKFALDIMNPHYPRYYSDKRPPTNDQDPNPITFLTVTDTTFVFALAPRNPNNPDHQSDVKQALEWLEEALEKYGVGGKTSAGYGYFKDVHNEQGASLVERTPKTVGTTAGTSSGYGREELKPSRVDPDLQKAEGYKREIDRMPTSAVASQIQAYYQRWQQIKSDDGRIIVARAIIEKVRQAGREKASAEKPWYKELLAFIEKASE